MPADKYIALVGGIETEVAGTVTGGTAAQDGKIPALDATGRLDASLMPVGTVADTYVGAAAETLSATAPFVYVKSDGQVANASAASGGNPTIGFVLAGAAAAAQATVYFEGRVTGLTGLTVGARYYLSDTTPGGLTTTPVTGAGKLHQYLGRAISTTTLSFECDDHIVRA
jgi:hypothetical protein